MGDHGPLGSYAYDICSRQIGRKGGEGVRGLTFPDTIVPP